MPLWRIFLCADQFWLDISMKCSSRNRQEWKSAEVEFWLDSIQSFVGVQPAQNISNQAVCVLAPQTLMHPVFLLLCLSFKSSSLHCEYRGCWAEGKKNQKENKNVFCRHSGVTTCPFRIGVSAKDRMWVVWSQFCWKIVNMSVVVQSACTDPGCFYDETGQFRESVAPKNNIRKNVDRQHSSWEKQSYVLK